MEAKHVVVIVIVGLLWSVVSLCDSYLDYKVEARRLEAQTITDKQSTCRLRIMRDAVTEN